METLGGSAIDLRFLEFQEDSSFQNLSKFLGIILGIIGLTKLGFSYRDIELRGDRKSELNSMSLYENPSLVRPMIPSIIPRNSLRFWKDESS